MSAYPPIKFVVIGSGNMATSYASLFRKLDETDLVAIVSRSGKRPAGVPENIELASSLGAVSSDFDAVAIATPNGIHHTSALEAAALGKHVLCEKVLDITSAAMEAMISACRSAGVRLGVAFQRRMSPDNQAVRKLIHEGRLGRVFAADLAVKFYRDQAYYDSAGYRGNRMTDGGGPFMQQAAHNIDIYVWFFGLPSRVVSMLDTFCHRMEGEDHGVAILRHGDGMIGSIEASTCCRPGFPARLEIHAEKGTVVLENDSITRWEVDGMPNPGQTENAAIHSGASSAVVTETAGHEAIIHDFVQAIREGRDPAVPGEDARRVTDLILQIYEQALV